MTNEQTPAELLWELETRLHILEGLVRVLDDPHAFVDITLAGTEPSDTVETLRTAFELSEVQALAALDMQFRRLGRTNQSRIRSEAEEMRNQRARLTGS